VALICCTAGLPFCCTSSLASLVMHWTSKVDVGFGTLVLTSSWHARSHVRIALSTPVR